MKARYIIVAFTLILAVLAGALAGNAFLTSKNRRMETDYINTCASYANLFRMEAEYVKTESGMPLAYFTFVRYERACGIVDYLNYVINEDKFWEEGNFYLAAPEDQIKAKQKLNELFGGELTIKDILERSYDVLTLFRALPGGIEWEILDDGGTQNENRWK